MLGSGKSSFRLEMCVFACLGTEGLVNKRLGSLPFDIFFFYSLSQSL